MASTSRAIKLVLGASLILAASVFETSCRQHPPSPAVPEDKRAVYGGAARLFGFAWRPDEFRNAEHRESILSLLNDFIREAHVIETKESRSEPDLGAALITQQQLLRDARNRFDDGDSDSAGLKLRGLTANCVSCHLRANLPLDFTGPLPSSDGSFESELAAAEFLFSKRELDQAGTRLKAIVKSSGSADHTFLALKLWVVNEIYRESPFPEITNDLTELTHEKRLDDDQAKSVTSWLRELYELENRPVPNVHPVTEAQNMLNPAIDSRTQHTDELHLVKTAYALRVLAQTLAGLARTDLSRKATYLTGVGNQHLPLPTFHALSEQFFVQTIRDYPDSAEAKKAYQVYEDVVESENSGSGGLRLKPDQIKTMSELRRLAFG